MIIIMYLIYIVSFTINGQRRIEAHKYSEIVPVLVKYNITGEPDHAAIVHKQKKISGPWASRSCDMQS